MKMWKWVAVGSLSVTAVYFMKRRFSGGVCHCEERLDGKIIIITGGNSGIGKAASYVLAEKGATIIVACRNKVEGLRVAEEISNSTGNSSITFEYLDLTSFESIRSFVQQLKTCGITNIYSLVNNAGIFYHPFEVTEDHFEITFQTNYLGPFYLTILLLNNKFFQEGSRIVNVVSEAHRIPKVLNVNKVSFPDPSLKQFVRYGESKLCLVLFTNQLAEILKGISVFSVNPGNVETDVYRHFPLLNNKFLFALQKPIRWIFVKTPEKGAQTIKHTLLDKSCSLLTGNYFSDCKVDTPSKLALNKELADTLWENSLKCCRITLNKLVEDVR